MQTTRFDELKATNQLPSPTGVALAILRLAEGEATTTQEIAHVLQTDPALSGRILKIANSAFRPGPGHRLGPRGSHPPGHPHGPQRGARFLAGFAERPGRLPGL